ncbi:MAG TPA: alkaline phosphatase family protein [Polyangiaceae bacterium]|nr:alkaline phosphatase family protein [Polyangiaceae bacterium]
MASFVPTIFDWLADEKRHFEIYVDGPSLPAVGVPSNLLLMRSQWGHLRKFAHPLTALEAAWQSKQPAPDVIYCEPLYNDFATVLGLHGDCNHPPLPVAFGESFLKRVYGILTSNPSKWQRTILVVCYDEHGGFFDHVAPPAMPYAPPDGADWQDASSFATLGVRIPGLIVSPLVEPRSVYKGLLDHTSILQLIIERWGDPVDLNAFGDAARRKNMGHVQSLSAVLTRSTPRLDDILGQIPDPPPPAGTSIQPPLTDTGRMFQAASSEFGRTPAA